MYVRPGHKSGCIVRRGGPFPSSFRSLSTRPPSHSLSLCLADTPYVCVSFFVSTVRSLTRSLSVRLFTARPASHERRPNLIREGLLNGIQRKPKLLSCVSLDFLSLSLIPSVFAVFVLSSPAISCASSLVSTARPGG